MHISGVNYKLTQYPSYIMENNFLFKQWDSRNQQVDISLLK